MNNWIAPHIKEQLSEIEESLVKKKQEVDTISYIENLPSPNYVLIDAALWGADINSFLESDLIVHRSLFRGSTGLDLWSVAPYLIELNSQEEFVHIIKQKDPIDRRVTWLYSETDIDTLRKHFRRFLRMKKEDGSYIYFRFYDPYVVNTVFPSLTNEQVLDFFENIEYIKTDDYRIGEKRIFFLSPEKKLQINLQKLV